MASAATERIQSAMRQLATEASDLKGDLYATTVVFKLLGEDLEGYHHSEQVEELGLGFLQVLACAEELNYQSLALQELSQNFNLTEVTDFQELLNERITGWKTVSKSELSSHKYYQQFKESIWNVHHAGEAAPGQEEDEIVMITSQYGVRNKTCPLSGKPVTDLVDPVRSTSCQHIYDRATVLSYLKKNKRRKTCACPVTGCPKEIGADNLICDASLKMEIQELRLRDSASNHFHSVADCTEPEEDDVIDLDD